MARAMDNENPTIVEVADLPTRKRERRTKKTGPRKADDVAGLDADLLWDDLLEDDEVHADGDATGEPIDEQEIYGTHILDHLRMDHSRLTSCQT